MIEVYDPTLATKQGEITAIIKGAKYERINADKTLNFEVALSAAITALINAVNVIKLDSDYYDIASYSKGENGGRTPTVNVECEHVSCRLNDSDYDVEYFTETGTPTQILTAILADTGFTVGTVEFSASATFSLQEATSRRSLLMQYAASLGAELDFNGFAVSLLTQRGSATPKDLTANKNLTMLSMSVDKRTLDNSGNPTVSYSCSIYDPIDTLDLGDAVTLEYALLGINVTLRIVGISIHPYDAKQVVIEVGNYINALEDDIYRIDTAKVSKDKLMNGVRIGPEYGFEAIRYDKKARAYYRSDQMAMQAGDGSGTNWENKLYYDYDSETGKTELYYNGKFTAEVIQALSAIITPNLYAEKATISELTVDQLDTSDKVKKYLTSDATPDNFQRIYDQYHELVTASTDGLEVNKVQAVNRDGDPLYWTDETHAAATTEETVFPVYTFNYTEQVKWKVFFYEYSTGLYVPAMKWGAGAPEDEDLDSCLMYKLEGEFWIVMTNADGTQIKLKMAGQNVVLEGNTGDFGVRNIRISDTAPTTPQDGDLWIDTSGGA